MKCNRYSCDMLIKRKCSRQIIEKPSNISLIKIHAVGAELLHANGRTGGHDEVNSCFSKF